MAKKVATFGGGCFWCIEAGFKRIKGVEKAVSGYMGGMPEHPSYQEVCTGETGHAEVVQVTYEEEQVSYETLLEVFWALHDPTTLNRQGADMGTQYRSVIFYHDEIQKTTAEKAIKALDSSDRYPDKVVTELSPAETFYPAEGYHQDYYDLNPGQGYCRVVIDPKIAKLKATFKPLLKENS